MNKLRMATAVAIAVAMMLSFGPMARADIVTQPFASLGGGAVVINFDHNTGNGNVLRFRVINGSGEPAWFGVYDCPNNVCSLVGDVTVQPGVTLEQVVPGISVQWTCEALDPAHPEWGCEWGLKMGTCRFVAQWPAVQLVNVRMYRVFFEDGMLLPSDGIVLR